MTTATSDNLTVGPSTRTAEPFARPTPLVLRPDARMHQLLADVDSASLTLPAPHEPVLPGLPWGRHDVLFTPAYWKAQAWLERRRGRSVTSRLGRTLADEVAACLLGGHGIPAEVGLAAFRHIRDLGLLAVERTPTADRLAAALAEPLNVGSRTVRYRFPRLRARYLASALRHIRSTRPPEDSDAAFRSWLLQIDGVGPKTASWITRNWLGSNRVAIIDIHIYRAGLIAGFFCPNQTVLSDYWGLEHRFLAFCTALAEDPAHLDPIIWRQMKECGEFARRMVPQRLKNGHAHGRLHRPS